MAVCRCLVGNLDIVVRDEERFLGSVESIVKKDHALFGRQTLQFAGCVGTRYCATEGLRWE